MRKRVFLLGLWISCAAGTGFAADHSLQLQSDVPALHVDLTASSSAAATPAAVTPEPSSVVMLGTGAILSGGLLWRRRQAARDVQELPEG